MANLAAKYRPQTWSDMTEQSTVVDIVKNLCQSDHLDVRNFLFTGPAGTGKAQPLDSLVLTTTGYKRMKDIKVRDEVYTHTGDLGVVQSIYPQGKHDVYKLTFLDAQNNKYICKVADNHLNYINLKFSRYSKQSVELKAIETLDLIELFKGCQEVRSILYVPNVRNRMTASSLEFIDTRKNEFNVQIPDSDEDMLVLSSIEYDSFQECQCIYIDHPDHTYITDDWIPTHNTTLARIIANELNEGKGHPIEIDAASNSGVESMRNIIQQARSYPVGTNWKIFIVDECHAFSNAAWQSALLTVEDVPAKTIFLFATTNPERIPGTILSRVQQFRLSKISLKGIESRLKYIVEHENLEGQNITYTDDAISYIAKMANGGMRDAITLLEKAIAGNNSITSESLMTSLGLPNYDDFFALLQAYAKKDNANISNIIDKVYNSGVNFIKWMQDFHAFIMNVVKFIYLGDINKTMIPGHYIEKISRYGTGHAGICLVLSNKLVKLNNELRFTSFQQELALTYLCTPTK